VASEQPARHKTHSPTAITTALLILLVIVLPFLFKHLLVTNTTKTVSPHSLPIPKQTKKTLKTELSIPQSRWVTIQTKKGDSLARVLRRVGVKRKTLQRLMSETTHQKALVQLSPGDEIKIKLDKQNHLLQLVLFLTIQEKLTISQNDNGHFHEKTEKLAVQNHAHYVSATVEHSLYRTAKKNHIPAELLKKLVHVFSEKIDFNREVRDNDRFTIIYNTLYVNDKKAAIGDIIAASYSNRQGTHYAIGFPGRQGDTLYYDPKGASLQLGFDRYPIRFTHIGSIFNLHRYHPILHVTRAHKGIDLAAAIGTPIKAVADGYITRIGLNGGYGNMIKVRHSQKYETVYAHMLRFQKGLSKGAKVLRGEVIGYVGQTGLATAPHCHYEFHVNNQSVNPAKVTLPNAPGVRRSLRGKFKSQANSLLSQLKLYQEASVNG
jgi:murein DD-endopeptidase MepM/ murein hydrolase activator NlpD